jgi:hypothetical protein
MISMAGMREHDCVKGGAPMSRTVITNDWRKLSKAARKERDPKKFVQLLKQLYDVVNEGEEERHVSSVAKQRRVKGARHEREAA